MLKAIGSNIFNTIVDQVPYAIQDLLREIQESASEHDPQADDDDDGKCTTQHLELCVCSSLRTCHGIVCVADLRSGGRQWCCGG